MCTNLEYELVREPGSDVLRYTNCQHTSIVKLMNIESPSMTIILSTGFNSSDN